MTQFLDSVVVPVLYLLSAVLFMLRHTNAQVVIAVSRRDLGGSCPVV